VQDQPLNISMESLLWQESLKLPMAVLAWKRPGHQSGGGIAMIGSTISLKVRSHRW